MLIIEGRGGCILSVVILKEETRIQKLDSDISVSPSPLSFFLFYLVIGDETRVIKDKGKEKEDPTK